MSQAPLCGGVCASGEACVEVADGACGCLTSPTCAASSEPACGGSCPVGETCVPLPSSTILGCVCE